MTTDGRRCRPMIPRYHGPGLPRLCVRCRAVIGAEVECDDCGARNPGCGMCGWLGGGSSDRVDPCCDCIAEVSPEWAAWADRQGKHELALLAEARAEREALRGAA